MTSRQLGINIDVELMEGQKNRLLPFGTTSALGRINLEGYLTYRRVGDEPLSTGYVQFFRSGRLESVGMSVFEVDSIGRQILRTVGFERDVIDRCGQYLAAMEVTGVEPPIVVELSLLDVKGFSMLLSDEQQALSVVGLGIDRNDLKLPAVLVNDWEEAARAAKVLQPVFNGL